MTKKSGLKAPSVAVSGVTASDTLDDGAAYKRAIDEWKHAREIQERKENQVLTFSSGPIALVCMADLHLGGSGVDYPRLFEEAELIANTPGMFVVLVGDLLDNFLVGRLVLLNIFGHLDITDEWLLLRRYLSIIGHKVVVSVGGNHDYWHTMLTGVDYLRDVLSATAKNALYDQNDARVSVNIGDAWWPGRIRHKWRLSSMYNESHGIEQAARHDQDFIWGVGAHLHRGGVARSFTVAGRSCMAVMCGSYKRVDKFAQQRGFQKPNNSTAVSIVFDEDTGSITGFDSLEMCHRFMRALYG